MSDEQQAPTILEVNAGPHDREDVIVSWGCTRSGDHKCIAGHRLYELDEAGEPTAEIPSQCLRACQKYGEGEEQSELVWQIPHLEAGETRQYMVEPGGEEEAGEDGVGIEITPGEKADVLVGGALFTQYNVSEDIARPYCYPVFGPGGTEITNFAPDDHIHHKSMYVAQGEVNGYDNWAEQEGHARTVNRELWVVGQGPIFGELMAVNDWVSPRDENLLQEITCIRVYNTPEEARIMEWDITWFAAYGGVFFGDTKEAGTLSVRVAESMEAGNGGTIRNSYGGIGEGECWGKRAPWVDYYGPLGSTVAGITIMDHPQNLRFPTYWHVRGYGLFTANQWGIHHFTGDWSQRGDFALQAGDAVRFLFRVYIHEGDTDEARVADNYVNFIYPPEVRTIE